MARDSGTKRSRRLAVKLPDADQRRYRETALADTKAILGHRFVVVLIALVALAGTEASAFLSSNELSTFEKLLLAGLAAGVGVLLILGPIVYAGSLVAAPHRQRKQARAELAKLTGAAASLAVEYSDWIAAKKAALPQQNFHRRVMRHLQATVRMSREDRARADYEQHRDDEQVAREIESVHAAARAEYHEKFRQRVLAALDGVELADSPKTIADLEAIGVALTQQAATPDEEPGEPVPPEHRDLLRELLGLAIPAVQNDVQVRYKEENPTADTHRQAFHAHFPKLARRLDAWDRSLFAVSQVEGELGHRILHEADRRKLLDKPFLGQNVVWFLRQKTLTSVYDRNEVSFQLREESWDGTIKVDGTSIAEMPKGEEEDRDEYHERVEAAIGQIKEYLVEIQTWDEKKAVSEAYGRHLILMDRQTLLAEIQGLGKVEIIRSVRSCPICRANSGDFG
jgi:hypothetical protein